MRPVALKAARDREGDCAYVLGLSSFFNFVLNKIDTYKGKNANKTKMKNSKIHD